MILNELKILNFNNILIIIIIHSYTYYFIIT